MKLLAIWTDEELTRVYERATNTTDEHGTHTKAVFIRSLIEQMADPKCPDIRMATQAWEALEYLKSIQSQQGIFHCSDSLTDRFKTVVRQHEETAVQTLGRAKEFRDRMIVNFRAFAMVLHMVSNASTHGEKNARLRGCIELIEGSITKLEKEQFDISLMRNPHFEDVFRSDYPTRHFVERIRDLEHRIEAYEKAEKAKPANADEKDNVGF